MNHNIISRTSLVYRIIWLLVAMVALVLIFYWGVVPHPGPSGYICMVAFLFGLYMSMRVESFYIESGVIFCKLTVMGFSLAVYRIPLSHMRALVKGQTSNGLIRLETFTFYWVEGDEEKCLVLPIWFYDKLTLFVHLISKLTDIPIKQER